MRGVLVPVAVPDGGNDRQNMFRADEWWAGLRRCVSSCYVELSLNHLDGT
jgi:hypothetical protein